MSKGDSWRQPKVFWGSDDSATPILHVDMDAFFVEAELLRRPQLRGKPVIVGGASARGVVSSASYQARYFGVKAGMPISKALQICPRAQVLPGDHRYYAQISTRVMQVFARITPQVEPVSIDEAFLDVSGARRLYGSPVQIARLLRNQIRSQLHLPASVGIAKNKLVAKIASAWAKPDGLLLIPESKTRQFLAQLPVQAVWGIGKVSAQKLEKHGIVKVAQLAELEKKHLVSLLGQAQGEALYCLARGIDSRPVAVRPVEKSVGSETTFETNLRDPEVLRAALLKKSYQCAVRLRAGGWRTRNVTIKLRAADFSTWTRSKTLLRPTDLGREIFEAADALFSVQKIPFGGIRLIGVTAKNLEPVSEGYQSAWDDNEKLRLAELALDQVNQKYGRLALRPATLLEEANKKTGVPGLRSGKMDQLF